MCVGGVVRGGQVEGESPEANMEWNDPRARAGGQYTAFVAQS